MPGGHLHPRGACRLGEDKLEESLLAIGDRVGAHHEGGRPHRANTLAVAEEMAAHRLGRPVGAVG